MYNVRKVADDIWWIGGSDRRIELFENAYPAPEGMSYNNYLIMDEKTCLMDGTDEATTARFFENLEYVLNGRKLDYMVVQHVEPDHCACIPQLIEKYPDLVIVASQKAVQMIKNFYHIDADFSAVKENDTLELGKHILSFVGAPMIHWPEVIVTYDSATGVLFSADAFGSFGALGGNIFADEVNWERDWADEARRYYVNIVGKYGPQTMALLKKASALDIKMILPLHGHIWRKDFNQILERYEKWATYTPEKKSVAIFYGSIYGHTANAADILAVKLAERGIKDIRVYDVSNTDVSELLSRAFEYSTLVFASATYNAGIFDNMERLLSDIKNHSLSGRMIGLVENGSWAPAANKKMHELVSSMKNMTILEPMVSIRSSIDDESLAALDELASALAETVK